MRRATRDITDKALLHTVYAAKGNEKFVVESGTSHELYRVSKQGTWYTCTCPWGENNPGTECSHITAVRLYTEAARSTDIVVYVNGVRQSFKV